MYESPITLFETDPWIQRIKDETDALIVRRVASAGVHMDKDELIKALEYDRGQYKKGYAGGLAYKPPVETNADRIRAMSDEELATWLGVYCNGQTAQEVGKPCASDMGSCEECWLDWLKQEVEEGE